MSILIVICPECGESAECEPVHYLRVAKRDAPLLSDIKHISIKETKGWSVTRPFYHAIHYPKISPSLGSIKDLPEKYSAETWRKGFDTPDKGEDNSVIHCGHCKLTRKHELNWPEDAFFKVEYKGRLLWARDRDMALKIMRYIESKDRKKRLGSNDNYIVQDRDLRKIPEHFQSANARKSISKKMRKILDLPSKALT